MRWMQTLPSDMTATKTALQVLKLPCLHNDGILVKVHNFFFPHRLIVNAIYMRIYEYKKIIINVYASRFYFYWIELNKFFIFKRQYNFYKCLVDHNSI